MFNDDIQVLSTHVENGDYEDYDGDRDDDDDGGVDPETYEADDAGAGNSGHCAVRPLRGDEGSRSRPRGSQRSGPIALHPLGQVTW